MPWHRQRHQEDRELIDRYFDAAAFESELAGPPGAYSPSAGQLLLAKYDGLPAGCVALKGIGNGACEMMRMFVYPQKQGLKIGRALATRVVLEAESAGYSVMRLDTSIRQLEAQGLYRSLGFRPDEPHYPLPDDLQRWPLRSGGQETFAQF